ncbi:MAG: autotransporter outer membrane beta-barrel domain-containing protein [Amphiplicatus sp.]
MLQRLKRERFVGKRKILLLCGAALTALSVPARAQIDGTITTPVRSSTINNGSPGDVVITSNGAIELEDADNVVAVTLDSDHRVENAGRILIENADHVTGVLVKGGVSGEVVIAGDIEILEDYERPDTDDDGDADGPYALAVGQTGLRVEAGGFAGDIAIGAGGSIKIEGNQSAGARIEGFLDGAFTSDGSISVLGDDAIGIELRAGASGDVLQSGTVMSRGEDARGVVSLGAIGGAFVNEGTVTATGFASTTLSNYVDPDTLDEDDTPIEERIDPEDLLDGGPAVAIGASVGKGFLNNGAAGDDHDENRTTGTIRSFGSGEAVLISAELNPAAGDIVLGKTVERVRDLADTDDDDDTNEVIAVINYDEGLINRGTISANGLNVGFDATALRLEGSSDGGRRVVVEGGLRNTGRIGASAFEADAVALSVGRHSSVPAIFNSGTIEAAINTEKDNVARAVFIEETADVGRIVNTGVILASSRGYGGQATAIADLSGGVESILNQGSIVARFVDDGEEDEGLGATVAIDLSGHGAGQGARLTQSRRAPVDDDDDPPTPAIIGDVLFGAGADRFDILAGGVEGDVSFGAGDDALAISDAALFGALDLGAGVDRLDLREGAVFRGAIRDPDGSAVITVEGAELDLLDAEPVTISTLSVTGGSTLGFSVESFSSGGAQALVTASGTATIARDTQINVRIERFRNQARTLALIEADSLALVGEGEIALSVTTPAIFKSAVETSDTTLAVALTPKTSAELGLNTNESAAFAPFLALADENEAVGRALVSYMEEDALVAAYQQLLPDHADAATRFIAGEASLANGVLAHRFDALRAGDGAARHGFWLTEQTSYLREKTGEEETGYDGFGFSFEGGYDRLLGDDFILGASGAARIGKFKTPDDRTGEVNVAAYELGLYASKKLGALALDLAGSAGLARLDSKRIVSFGDILDIYEGDDKGFFYAGSARLSYRFERGSFYFAPSASADYFRMSRDGHVETGTGADAPFALEIGEADTGRAAATAMAQFGRAPKVRAPRRALDGGFTLGGRASQTRFFQHAYAGYRTILSQTLYRAEARFVAVDDVFEIADLKGYDDAVLFGLALGAAGDSYVLSFNYDGEFEDSAMSHRFGAVFRLSF